MQKKKKLDPIQMTINIILLIAYIKINNQLTTPLIGGRERMRELLNKISKYIYKENLFKITI